MQIRQGVGFNLNLCSSRNNRQNDTATKKVILAQFIIRVLELIFSHLLIKSDIYSK